MCANTTNTDEGEAGVDAVVVGAGFSGLYMSYRLRELGLSVRVFEKADDVGGTWYWNRYPGARCDSESHIYCYSFSEEIREEWTWTERYPEQPEILDYLRFVADRLDLRQHIEFDTTVESATFDEDTGRWTVTTADGDSVDSRFFISAVGCLSEPYTPDFDNRDAFEGGTYHTARWPADGVDLAGKRLGVIGTGSTGIQLTPEVADRAAHLTVFQRTPNYAVPARNRPLDDAEWREIKANYDDIWAEARFSWLGMPFEMEHATTAGMSDDEIEAALERRWQEGGFRFLHTFEDTLFNPDTNEIVSEFLREKIREQVDDPETAETLVPTEHPYGSKRPPMDYGGYYEMFNRGDVTLADVKTNPITGFTPDGIQTTDAEYDLDIVIFATGFDAMTGALLAMDIEGRDGSVLDEEWDGGPRTYLGLGVDGFPNLFTITGPQSPAVLSNMPVSIEQHVDWIADCIEYMQTEGYEYIEPQSTAAEQWVAQTNALAEQMLFSEADSWYRGANVPGKPRVFTPFPGGVETYRRECERVVENGYEGFNFFESSAPLSGAAD